MVGTLYLINGATSTGKTSTARALQNKLANPNVLLGIDTFHLSIPPNKCQLSHPDPNYFKPVRYEKLGKSFCKIAHGKYIDQIDAARFTSIGVFLKQNIHVVSDEVFWRKETVATFIETLAGHCVYMVGLLVDDEVGEARSLQRDTLNHCNDDVATNFRPQGMSRASAFFALQFVSYDLTINTTHISPEQCAQQIVDFTRSNPPVAFGKLATGA